MVNMAGVCFYMLVSMPVYDQLRAWMIPVLYTTPSLLATVYIYRRMPETRGRNTADIVQMLSD
jgi:hypothetical protein